MLQANRLLGISSQNVVLLDMKTKVLAKTQNISDLDEWRTGGGKSQDGLILEFRGTKTWKLSMLSPNSLKTVTAVLWDALDMHGRFLNSSTLRRESFEFGICQFSVFVSFLSLSLCIYYTATKFGALSLVNY